MEIHSKVFKSNITRTSFEPKNDLYELLNTTQASPIVAELKKEELCNFTPKTDKFYVPKRKSKLKVKTVRDIRKTFEQDMYNYYSGDIEKHGTILLKKIKSGLSNDEDTMRIAKNLLNSDTPISRSVWQMLSNINPHKHTNPKQYIIFDGKQILINGSKGGKQKNIAQINSGITSQKKPSVTKKISRRKGLLQNSLVVKFKPGPLQRKKYLDDSHQKFNLGNTELVNLPRLGLAINPSYGVALDGNVSIFLNKIRNEDGWLTENWAEFAVSVLGTVKDYKPIQNENQAITFDIDYKLNQKRILMRRDVVSEENGSTEFKNNYIESRSINDLNNIIVSIEDEVHDVVDKILESVDISIKQDAFFTGEDEPREAMCIDSTNIAKGKNKNKFSELDRLDVTVIRLPEEKRYENQTCNKPYCLFGCVCKSLDCNYSFKNHCGLLECMFECQCDFSDYKNFEELQNDCIDIIPGLVNFNNEINLKLSKEEKKFKQTVVVAGEKSIVLKTRKRNGKATKRYAEYHAYTKRFKKVSDSENPEISVIINKLNCHNIEPWCMIHNLYKCFCKGRFTTDVQNLDSEEKILNKVIVKSSHTELVNVNQTLQNVENKVLDKIHCNPQNDNKIEEINENNVYAVQTRKRYVNYREETIEDYHSSTCARIRPYLGRKHDDIYYKNIQSKISSMEKNDHQLSKKIAKLQNTLENEDDNTTVESECQNMDSQIVDDNEVDKLKSVNKNIPSEPTSLVQIINNLTKQSKGSTNNVRSLTCKNNLVKWFENSYKLYKNRLAKGLKIRLEPPKTGKLAMHPWDFILSRYRERKNLFMVSKSEPFRIFISVQIQNPFFNKCMNIDKIRFAELQKYHITIKNLLTNATDLEETYCILYGFSDWWELIGTIAKVKSLEEKMMIDNQDGSSPYSPSITQEGWNCSLSDETCTSAKFTEDSWSYSIIDDDDSTNQSSSFSDIVNSGPKSKFTTKRISNEEMVSPISTRNSFSEPDGNSSDVILQDEDNDASNPESNKTSGDFSKWFAMTVENDFTEIRFNKGGFFVTYEKITKAINAGRVSGKTIRLSSQKCVKNSNQPPYGLYTIPNSKEYRVFIGPYEPNESLGIQTIKKIAHLRKLQKTRGIWITTDKKDNHKLIDNPISFIPNLKDGSKEMMPLQNFSSSYNGEDKNTDCKNQISPHKTTESLPTIKIKRSNDFYHITSAGNIKTVPNWNPNIISDDSKSYSEKDQSSSEHNDAPSSSDSVSQTTETHSNSAASKMQKKMFILKPEQINNKLLLSNTLSKVLNRCDENNKDTKITEKTIKEDVAETSQNVFLISDDDCDDDIPTNVIKTEQPGDYEIKNVWIQCSNVNNFGWIRGKRKSDNLISLQFPGFGSKDYYSESEAFAKINEILDRVIDIPENLILEWQVLDSENDLDSDQIQIDRLDEVTLKENIKGHDEIKETKESVAEELRNSSGINENSVKNEDPPKQMFDVIQELEMESQKLEDETESMWNETLTKKQEILASLTDQKLKKSMTDKLKVIQTMADDSKIS